MRGRKVSLEEWEERKVRLLEYLKENPRATSKDVIKAGHASVLLKVYGGRINEAKAEAGVPRGKKRKLTPSEWEERKRKLLEFLRENPEATRREASKAGHTGVLWKIYGGRINEAKAEAGVLVERKRKLTSSEKAKVKIRKRRRWVFKKGKNEVREIITEILKRWKIEEEYIEEIAESAIAHFQKVKEVLLKGRGVIKVSEVCCYLACRQLGIPVPSKPPRKIYLQIIAATGSIIPIGHPEKYVPIICERLLPKTDAEKVAKKATGILSSSKISFVGKSEKVLAAAAVYLAAKELKYLITQEEVSKAAHTTSVSLRNTLKMLRKTNAPSLCCY